MALLKRVYDIGYGIIVKDLSYFYIELAFNDLNKVVFLLPWLKGYKNVHKWFKWRAVGEFGLLTERN